MFLSRSKNLEKVNKSKGRTIQLFQVQEKEAGKLQYDLSQSENNDNERECMRELLRVGIREELTDRQRTCLLRYISGDRVEKIAADLGIKESAVYKRIRNAKKRLKKLGYTYDIYSKYHID